MLDRHFILTVLLDLYLKLAKVMCPAAYSDYSAYTCCLLHLNPALVASYHA